MTYRKPKIIRQVQRYTETLTEQQQEDLLRAHEVGWEVVPKVLQGLWLPKKTPFSMSSQLLSKLAVGVTKAVEDQVAATLPTMSHLVRFTRTVRDAMVRSILNEIRLSYSEQVLFDRIKFFAPDLLDTITAVTAQTICKLYTPKPAVMEEAQTTPESVQYGVDHQQKEQPESAVVPSQFTDGGVYTPIRVCERFLFTGIVTYSPRV